MSDTLAYKDALKLVNTSDRFCVAVHTGDRVDYVTRNRYGQLTVETYVDAVGERRMIPLTEARFEDLVDRYTAFKESIAESPFSGYDEVQCDDDR
ncbi:hypothetical protein GL213_05430 [Halogeometricum borinquense]|uniref:Uncharacterized protein n=2 Tax=Halogeometricum borinquense TaxID=60847 RepID=E4NQB2_HALBP|nr:hypothetical protein [Halogeometricum borinquense]ADQ66674.1 hypothetical protein Hbor_10840 [Halogeometricum borinquense DSM 11551]QIB75013.1 hypothetical protein G3I44_12420 [Halogeometricum borinquense]QIQ76009.1 hypothetical protein GL213_05430 [Halogeometricum borinquense]RYJ14520.1 hypothetical protein ELS19_11530 [Halogeometricum borinquense]